MKCISIGLALLFLLSLCACTGTGDTQSSGGNPQLTEEYKMGYQLGYYAGFRDGARAGYGSGRNAEYFHLSETFEDWFYDAYPQYR